MRPDDAVLLSHVYTQILALRSRHQEGRQWGVGETWKWVQIRQKLRDIAELAEECLAHTSDTLADAWRLESEDRALMQPITPFLTMWMIVFLVGRGSCP